MKTKKIIHNYDTNHTMFLGLSTMATYFIRCNSCGRPLIKDNICSTDNYMMFVHENNRIHICPKS